MLLADQDLAAPKPRQPSITELVHRFRATGSLRVLMHLAASIARQRRALELLYGGYCAALYRPSPVHPPAEPEALDRILSRRHEFTRRAVVSRDELLRTYRDQPGIHDLPAGFSCVRRESVWLQNSRLILGEYGEGARLVCISGGTCLVSEHYTRMAGVRHIHSIQKYGNAGEFLVATGDGLKMLDLWRAGRRGLQFVRRLQKRLAGYTAAAEVGGEYYFGSDFSGRPNFIAVLGGGRYFFPAKAYLMHAAAFHVLFDRYIVSVNKELNMSGGRRALCVFDARTRRFVYCGDLDA
jgi:hypothetical protein